MDVRVFSMKLRVFSMKLRVLSMAIRVPGQKVSKLTHFGGRPAMPEALLDGHA